MVEPVVCVPIASGTMKSPTAAAEPCDEPPGTFVESKEIGARFLITHGGVADFALVAEGTGFGLVWVEAGDLIFISGQTPLDAATGKLVEGDISVQARQCLDNLKAILEAAGLGFAHVLKTNIFLTNMADFAAVNEIYKSYFAEPYPARSTVAVAALPMGAAVEIEMIASRSAQ